MAEIIAVANQKGGMGKTTTATTLVDLLNLSGAKALYVDGDPQCNGTDSFKAKVQDTGTLYDLLAHGDIDCIQHTERGDIIAGDPALNEPWTVLKGAGANHKLKEGLAKIGTMYDYIVIDTPPSLSLLLTNALTAADKVIIPLTATRYGMQGLTQLHDTVKEIKAYTNPNLVIDGMLLIKHNGRTNIAKTLYRSLEKYAEKFGTRIFETKIRKTVAVEESQVAQTSLFDWAPDCTAAEDYKAFFKEFKGVNENG